MQELIRPDDWVAAQTPVPDLENAPLAFNMKKKKHNMDFLYSPKSEGH